ncbi:MAG: protein phosphatase CheZ [Rhodospirillales bacterium]|nr:protein phosphatase CheZ [Rhodospirillales bacterium]
MSKDLFKAEIMQGRIKNTANAPLLEPETGFSVAKEHHQQIIKAIASLDRRLESVLSQIDTKPSSATEEAADCDTRIDILRKEIGEMSRSIADTKREIAALRQKDSDPHRLLGANDELAAVVRATEAATETILAAAEEIDSLASRLRSSIRGSSDVAALEEISERIIRIFEACNFQDITGQRISKVVNTMMFVEERVERMVEILGGPDSFAEVEPPEDIETTDKRDDSHLLHGPQLDTEQKISQDDIDKLFD